MTTDLNIVGVEVEDPVTVRLSISHLTRVRPELKFQRFL